MRSLSYGKKTPRWQKEISLLFYTDNNLPKFLRVLLQFFIFLSLCCVLCLSRNDPKTFPTHKIGNKEHTGYTNPLIIGARHKNGCTHPPWRGLEPLVIFVSLVLVPAGDLKAIGILQHPPPAFLCFCIQKGLKQRPILQAERKKHCMP